MDSDMQKNNDFDIIELCNIYHDPDTITPVRAEQDSPS